MQTTALLDRQQLILDQETAVANKLARLVMERPTPPIWMIFIPIFFVFHAWRIKQYGSSLKGFAESHLQSRRVALDAAGQAFTSGHPADLDDILSRASDLPAQGPDPYRRLMTLLLEHYQRLLSARSTTYPGLLRQAYGDGADLRQDFAGLVEAEQQLRLALIATLEGDRQQLQTVVDNIGRQLSILKEEEVSQAFS